MTVGRWASTQSAGAKTPAKRFRRAIGLLSKFGVAALKPRMITPRDPSAKVPTTASGDYRQVIDNLEKRRLWPGPVWIGAAISNRVAQVLRKQAIRDKTYGTFTPGVGGWDPQWDIDLARSKPHGMGRLISIRRPKKTRHQRTREDRALKLEKNMEGMDERMDALRYERQKQKPVKDIEYKYKELIRKAGKK